MKIKVIVILILLFGLIQISYALGLRNAGTITAVVNVKSMFQLSMTEGVIDFITAEPGKTSESDKDVMVVSRTSGGKVWYLQVSNDQPLTSGSNIISNKNFSWMGETKGKGKWFGAGPNRFDTSPKVAYQSAEDEVSNLPDGTANNFKFRLFIPERQAAGTYSCTVMFTMTE